MRAELPGSVPGVCDVEEFAPATDAGAPSSKRLLIEVPHGATSSADFDAVRELLVGEYPEDLREFFFVNTDVGAPETAREIARRVAARAAVVVLRCRIPRTFIDVNRVVDAPDADYAATGITPGLPEYVTDPTDVARLRSLHVAYQRAADRAFEAVCGSGGFALILHTYAPRSVDVGRVDAGIVGALRAAYEPSRYESWPRRPEVEIIDRTPDGLSLAWDAAARAVHEAYAGIGIDVRRNETYRLDPATTGHGHAWLHRGRVLCVEINRERLADPFDPFVEMRVSSDKAAGMAAPLAEALSRELSPG